MMTFLSDWRIVIMVSIACMTGSCSACAASVASAAGSYYEYKAIERALNLQEQLLQG